MANSDKNIVITPNRSSSSEDPKIVFSGADSSTAAQNLTMKALPANSGTISVDGSAGQLFSIANTLTGTIFSVNDVSGMPALEVFDTGKVKLTGGQIPRVYSTTSTSGLTPNSDLYDTMLITTLSANLTVSADVGSPVDGQRIIFRIYSTGSYTVSWNNGSKGFRNIGVTLPTSLANGVIYYVGCVYNSASTIWDAIAVKQASI